MNRFSQWLEMLRERIAAHALTQKLWARYEAAAPREQLAVRVLSVFFLVLVIVLSVMMPLHRFNADAIAALHAQQDTLTWMQANRASIGKAGSVTRKPGDSVLTLANQSARDLGITFKRYEPKGERGLSLWLEQVSFEQVVKWLDVLERDYGVIAVDFSASRRNEAGLVDVRLILQG
ncbi:MAG TPA: type II secretion system protein M [Spongiibacteraceae bacterium]|nr:type II secretion system protein M [Spongiibacteraceae bacterium]